jgi:hypothetical protein
MKTKLPGRKRGGQPGNKNALGHVGRSRAGSMPNFKHGLYAQRFLDGEPRNVEVMNRDLDGDIAMLRRHIDGLDEKLHGTDYNDTALRQLDRLGDLMVKLATVIRTQAWLTGQVSPASRNSTAAIFMHRDDWDGILK